MQFKEVQFVLCFEIKKPKSYEVTKILI